MVGCIMSMNPTSHWWIQKVTSLVLIPLCGWLLWAGMNLSGADHETAQAFMARPINSLMAVAFVAIGMYHATLGIQTIVEDYLPEALGKAALAIARIGSAVGVLAVAYSAFKLTFGA